MPWKLQGGSQYITAESYPALAALEPAAVGSLRILPDGIPGTLNPGPCFIKRYEAGWAVPSSDSAARAYINANPIPNTTPLADHTYIIPGAGAFGSESFDPRPGAIRPLKLRLRPNGPANTFQTVRIGLMNNGDPYTINRCYLMRAGNTNTAVTENFDTGIVTVSAAPVVIAAGTDEDLSLTWLSLAIPTGSPRSEVVLLIEAAGGSPNPSWGASNMPGLGWVPTNDELLNNNLSSGINLSGQQNWGIALPVVVEFGGLSTPVCTLPAFGDSWIYAYGDQDQYTRPYGLMGRLSDRWRTSGDPIAPINFGRNGFRTSQTLPRIEFLLANLDIRAMLVQFNSLNNVILDPASPVGGCRTDWDAVESLAGSRRLLPIVAGGTNNAPVGWWTTWVADMDWMVARNPQTNVDTYDTVVNIATGEINTGFAFTADYTHLNWDGYDQQELDAYANIRAVLAGWGV